MRSLRVYMQGEEEEEEGLQGTLIHSVSENSFCWVPVLSFKTSRENVVYVVCAWQYEYVTAALPPAQSHLGPLVHWEPEGGVGGQEVGRNRGEGVCATCVWDAEG